MEQSQVEQFFDRYQKALLDRDAKVIAQMYAVPSLIVFPENVIAVSSEGQTEQFFDSSWQQYEGVEAVARNSVVMGKAPHSVWVDVTWSHDGTPRERMCYQLIEGEKGFQIAVLTLMALPASPKSIGAGEDSEPDARDTTDWLEERWRH